MIQSKINFFSPFHFNLKLNGLMILISFFFLYLGVLNVILSPFLISILLVYKIFDWFRIFINIRNNTDHNQWTDFKDSKFFKNIVKTKWILYLISLILCSIQLINLFMCIDISNRVIFFISIPIILYYTSIFYKMTIEIK